MSSTMYVTIAGHKKLVDELDYLKNSRRLEVAKRLHNAIEDGADVLENAEYEAAMNEQAFVEGRINELEVLLSMVTIVEGKKGQDGIVDIGSIVTFQEKDFDPEVFEIVGIAESDAESGKISHDSPLGRALTGHKVGDKVTVDAPAGSYEVEILKVE
ncbi:MAG: transcription elongation factor GreA [Anaerolineaceae bacterium]|nr:transcription elongation factor GreA [Anaerolineaceae bacterium]